MLWVGLLWVGRVSVEGGSRDRSAVRALTSFHYCCS
jgi:hypothetical protein